jgi:predicted RNase H-like HicB family nuclease
MKDAKQYKVIVEMDEDGFFIGRVASLPGSYTQAKSMIKLRKRIQETILLCLEVEDSDPDYKI